MTNQVPLYKKARPQGVLLVIKNPEDPFTYWLLDDQPLDIPWVSFKMSAWRVIPINKGIPDTNLGVWDDNLKCYRYNFQERILLVPTDCIMIELMPAKAEIAYLSGEYVPADDIPEDAKQDDEPSNEDYAFAGSIWSDEWEGENA